MNSEKSVRQRVRDFSAAEDETQNVREPPSVRSPLATAIQGKGLWQCLRRSGSLFSRYGVTAGKQAHALAQLAAILKHFECRATLPITAILLKRHAVLIRAYQAQGFEFAIHGYRHVDYTRLPLEVQHTHLSAAKQAFRQAGIRARGFRSPYIRSNEHTLAVLEQQGLLYDASQGLAWDVIRDHETSAYRHVFNFYRAVSATRYPAVPEILGNLVRLPYGLPDDEALIERLALKGSEHMQAPWLEILHRTHELGELFTLGLHPERVPICREPLMALLEETRTLRPAVWIARLDEIADWWRARLKTVVQITPQPPYDTLRITVSGPFGTTVLARAVAVDAPTAPWDTSYRHIQATQFTIPASPRPFIGLSPATSPQLAHFLCQQGYIIDTSEHSQTCSYYIDQPSFTPEHKRPLLAALEQVGRPLLRLGRWPHGARSALSITGDIDAITLWDYGLRLLGR